MLKPVPINVTAERPGSADWRIASDPETPQAIYEFAQERDLLASDVSITVGEHRVRATVLTDDPDMKSQLDEYFLFNDALRSRYTETVPVRDETAINIAYITDHGLEAGDDHIGSSGLPYEGLYDASGTFYGAVGRRSIGTFKSLVIGAMSGVLAAQHDMVPVHSAIVSAPSGSSFAFSGRGNMGKTTSLLATFDRLTDAGFKVLTDDWAMIDETTLDISPVDFLVGIRPESLDGLTAVHSEEWVEAFRNRLLSFTRDRSKARPLGISEVYGSKMVSGGGILRGVVLASVNALYTGGSDGHKKVDFTPIDNAVSLAARMRDDAYHAPEIPRAVKSDEETPVSLATRYTRIAERLHGAMVYTRTEAANRKPQAKKMADWIINVSEQ